MQYRIKFGISLAALLLAAGCSSGSEPSSASGEVVSVSSAALATSNDLTIGYIQRVPVMNWVQNSTNPSVDGWPTVGQNVTWRGYVRNFSSSARNNVQYQWQWDGVQVATGSVNIAANSTATVDYVRGWDFSRHNLTLVIDTTNAVAEDEEGNNSLTVVSNALSLGLWVEQSTYNYFLAHQRELSGAQSTCWDNWAQRQVAWWNANLYAAAVFPETPQGVLDRTRLDEIVIVPDGTLPKNGGVPTNDPDLNDHTVDLEWGFPATEVASGGAYSDTTTVSMSNAFYYEQSLPHELGHARYLIDDYGFNVHQQANGSGRDGIPQTENGATIVGSPFLPMVSSDAVYYTHQSGLMNGDDYLHMDRYSATALNRIWGNRATQGNANAPGNFGVFLNDLPLQNQVTLTDASTGAPLAGAQVSVYQSTGNGQLYGKNFSATPSQTLTADSSGNIQLGHNPFTSGSISPWHDNTDILLRIQSQNKVRYMFMEASDFNLEFWRGHPNGAYALSVAFQPGAVVGTGSGQPDLVVTSAGYSPSTVAPGQPMTFTATVKNQGTGATPAGTIIGVSFNVDGTQVSWSDTDTQSLAPGASVTLTANNGPGGSSTWTSTYGAHSLQAWVDDVNRIAESDETNNKLTTPFTVGPDLVVTQVNYSPTTAGPGTPMTFSAIVKNVGSQATPAGTITGVSFNVDGTQVSWSDTDTQSLAPGASVTLTANNGPQGHSTWTATSGAHTVQGWVDDVNRIAEGNENNNKLSVPVSVGIDLAVTSVTASPASPNSGNAVTFSAVVTNLGTTATPAGTIVGAQFDVDGVEVSWSDTDTQSLEPGASVTLTANSGPGGSSTWTATSGSHTVQAWVDDVSRFNDVNRNNNKLTSPLTVH